MKIEVTKGVYIDNWQRKAYEETSIPFGENFHYVLSGPRKGQNVRNIWTDLTSAKNECVSTLTKDKNRILEEAHNGVKLLDENIKGINNIKAAESYTDTGTTIRTVNHRIIRPPCTPSMETAYWSNVAESCGTGSEQPDNG